MYGTRMEMVCGAGCEADYAEALTRWAKVELLKEKVKQKMDARFGEKLDKMADLIVELAVERAKNAEELETREEALGKELEEFDAGE